VKVNKDQQSLPPAREKKEFQPVIDDVDGFSEGDGGDDPFKQDTQEGFKGQADKTQ